MTSVDDLFRRPNAPGKRKLEDPSSFDPNAIYSKSAKLSNSSASHSNGRASTVEDEPDLDDVDAGPELPPQDDVPDDEEGRFFGGGITNGEKEVLDFIEAREGEDGGTEEVVDAAWLRKMALSFEKRISKNAEMRAKFEDSPERFMASEADLDADIKALSILSEHTKLYEEFVRLGCVASLVSLLAHENTDVAIDVIEILGELTDEDTGADEWQWKTLVNAMLEADVVDLLTQNLTRLDEASETDRNGVYHVLSVIENLSSQTDNADRIGQKSNMLEWLLNRVQQKEKVKVSQNTQYAAEVLAILLQASSSNRRKFAAMDGVDALLQLLSGYRKRDPEKDSDEEEYVENLFDSLTCLVDERAGKGKFLEAEGVELCLIMLREGKMSKFRALRILDHVLGGVDGASSCERFVTVAGLKTVFGMFMKKQDKATMEHLLGVFSSLLRFLLGGSAARIRTLAKFMEKDYEKITKLVALRKEYTAQVQKVEREIDEEKKAIGAEDAMDMEAEFLSRRLDAGLFSLQTLDVILAWLVAEDDGARLKIGELMGGGNEGSIILKSSLQRQLDEMDSDAEDRTSAKAILQALIDCL